jgi:hypothetical protein
MMSVTVTSSTRSCDPLPANSNSQNKDVTVLSEPDTKGTLLKLSPDCVAAIVDPTPSDCELHLRLPANVVTKTGCSSVAAHDSRPREYADSYNLPPIRTPLHTRRIPLFGLDSPTLSKLPEDSAAMILDTTSEVGGSAFAPCMLPCSPQIPKPIAISGKSRRVQSDTLAQVQSNQRRSIFGHYFKQQQQEHQPMRTQSHSSDSVPSRNDRPQQQGQRRHEHHGNIQQDRRCNLSSSASILETVAIQPIQVDYRMFAPPKEHAHKSAICGRFHSVEDLSVTLDLDRRALPPLPSPLRRFCSSSEVNLSLRSKDGSDSFNEHSNKSPKLGGGMQGMYPLLTPVPILRQSSFFPSPSGNRNKSNSDYGIHSYLNKSFNLTESSRTLKLRSCKGSPGGHHFIKKTSGSNVSSSTTSSSDEMSSSQNLDDKNNKTTVRFDPRVTVTEFEDAVERAWYDDYELERLKRETILLTQQYLLTHPMEADKYFRATLDPVTNTYRKRPLFSLPVLSSEDAGGSDDEDHSHLSASLSTMTSESLQELCKDQVKRILIVDPNPSILALFCKSMSSMFPTAELETAQSAERALNLVKAAVCSEEANNTNFLDSISSSSYKFERESHAFDIIIIEQSLYPHSPHVRYRKTEPASGSPRIDCDSSRKRNGARMMLPRTASMPQIAKQAASTVRSAAKPGSFFHHDVATDTGSTCREPRCGSELTRAIVKLGQHDHPEDSSSKSTANATAFASNFEWKALLIGVSMYPDHHARLMQEAGSDIVWGKPIPRVGDTLRNQLLEALLDKRRGSSINV